ncbi:ArsC family reductase [Motilimonas pumila]|uniref:ArsC family reductase n=1 Tax=Motilimonas pumila TaxID=2303987 RepID=A0A418YGW8_9GAMM|nr:ArsC family reductase [Motilimonas pumila]RJG49102.1 ArsC family reductase [Motilimonas pumila]
MADIILYGLAPSVCDTVKKAKKWLEAQEHSFTLHDYRKDGIDAQMIDTFLQYLPWQQVVNKRGTTYRQLSDEQKAQLDEHTARTLLLEYPAMIKRPILVVDGQYHLGFKLDQYQTIFATAAE